MNGINRKFVGAIYGAVPLFLFTFMFLAAATNSMTAFALFSHGGRLIHPHDLWHAWRLESGVIAGLTLSAFLYFRGAFTMRKQSLAEGGIRGIEAACFAAGWLAVFVALVSPLDSLGEALFSAHAAQRE